MILFLLVLGFCFSACKKKDDDHNLHCFGTTNKCSVDTVTVLGATSLTNPKDSTCLKLDAVNVRGLSLQTNNIKLGESINISLEALGLNNSATGVVLFASAYDNKIVEVKTFAQYNTCANITSTDIQNLNSNYKFKPTQTGEYNFTFINVYGEELKVKATVIN